MKFVTLKQEQVSIQLKMPLIGEKIIHTNGCSSIKRQTLAPFHERDGESFDRDLVCNTMKRCQFFFGREIIANHGSRESAFTLVDGRKLDFVSH